MTAGHDDELPLSEDERIGQTAVNELTRNASVFLAWSTDSSRPQRTDGGTGIVVVTPARRRAVVLTVRHNVEGDRLRNMMVGWQRSTQALPLYGEARLHPDSNLDVAMIIPNRDAEVQLEPLAIDSSLIDPDPTLREHDWLNVFGYPTSLVKTVMPKQRFRGYTLPAPAVRGWPNERGLLEVEWVPKRALMYDEQERAHPAPDEPEGLSGSALWRVRPNPAHELWSAQRQVRILGLQTSWLDVSRKLLFLPAARWLPWLIEQLAALDVTG